MREKYSIQKNEQLGYLQSFLKYVWAILISLLTMNLEFLLSDLLGPSETPFLTSSLCIMYNSWVGGTGPGLVSTLILGSSLFDHFVLHSVSLPTPTFRVYIEFGFFVLQGILAVYLTTRLRRSTQNLKAKNLMIRALNKEVLGREKRLNLIQQSAGVFGWEWDLKNKNIVWSGDVLGVAGFQPTKSHFASGLGFKHVLGEDRFKVIHAIRRSFKTKQRFSVDFHFRWPDGTVHYLQSTAQPFFDLDGKPYALMGITKDISDRKADEERIRKSESRLSFALEVSKMGAWEIDLNSGLCNVTDSALPVNAMPRPKFHLSEFLKKIHPEDLNRVNDVRARAISTGQDYDCEYRVVHPDSTIRWIRSKGRALKDPLGKRKIMYGTIMDTTDQMVASEELKRAKEAAEAADRAKSAFLANMSHEIRTPLHAILGFNDLLLGGNIDLNERVQFAATIRRNGKLLARLIDDILDLSKVEAGKLVLERVNISLADLIRDVILLLSPNSKAKGVSLRAEINGAIPATIVGDPDRLKQILMNMIGNAIKFSDFGEVKLHIAYITHDPLKSGTIMFDIEDQGRGMSDAEQERIFQIFSQADDSISKKFGGTGLGLILSRHLARLMGGDVVLRRSQMGHGSTFTVTVSTGQVPSLIQNFISSLEISGNHFESNMNTLKVMPNLMGRSVLVVDDSAENRLLVRRILTRSGAEVEEALDGFDGIERATRRSYDVVLMDMQMPHCDGWKATRYLREKGYSKPILALTASAMKEDRDLSLKAGCNDHITKPIEIEQFVSTVFRYCPRTI